MFHKIIYGLPAVLLIVLSIQHTASGQDMSAYQKGSIENKNLRLPFRWLAPRDPAPQKKYPLVIFLHGGFEKGNDNIRQLSVGGAFFLSDTVRAFYPSYVVFPQCPENDAWVYFENRIDFATGQAVDWNFPFYRTATPVTIALKKLVDSLVAEGHVDPARLYVIGISQGGMGVLDLLARYPGLFAAGVSISGAGEPSTARIFAGRSALWLFHGEKDEVVPVGFSRDFASKLRKLPAQVNYTEYSGEGHDISARVFADPDLLQWLFLQHK